MGSSHRIERVGRLVLSQGLFFLQCVDCTRAELQACYVTSICRGNDR